MTPANHRGSPGSRQCARHCFSRLLRAQAGWAGTASHGGGRLAQPLQRGAGRDIPRVWGSTASQQGRWHAPRGRHVSAVSSKCSSSSLGASAPHPEPPQSAQASPFTLASPPGPGVCRGNIYQAGVAQSPVVLAGSSERRAGGSFSSSIVATASQKVGSGFGSRFTRPAQRCWHRSASAELGWREDGASSSVWPAGVHLVLVSAALMLRFTCWPLHPKCMLTGGCMRASHPWDGYLCLYKGSALPPAHPAL